MRLIYIVDGSVDITGSFVCARNEALALRGVADCVLVLPRESRIPDTQLEPFARIVRLPIISPRKSLKSITLYFPILLWSSWLLLREIKYDKPCAVQINDFYLMHGIVCRLMGFRGRVVTWVRFDPNRFGRFLSHFFLRMASAYSDQLVAVSRFIQKRLSPNYGSVILYDAVMHREDVQSSLPLAKDTVRRLVYVGNYISGKGQDDAISAFSKVAFEFPDLVLEFYGGEMGLEKNQRYRKRLEAMASELGLEERVFIGDSVADSRDAFKNGFVGLNFSRSESFSMTVLEAASVGIPVVATQSGGPQEIIDDGISGLLVPVGDIQSMAHAISLLAQNPQLARTMGKTAQRIVSNRFGTDRFRTELMDILNV